MILKYFILIFKMDLDVLLHIFEYLDNYKKIVESTVLSKSISSVVKFHNWYIPANIDTIDNLNYILNNFKFKNLNIRNCSTLITDNDAEKLGNCYSLDLSFCYKITDKSVEKLGNCRILNLSFCYQITDESVEKLGNSLYLNLSNCDKITDKSVEKLTNCRTLCLYGCDKITIECINKLKENGCNVIV